VPSDQPRIQNNWNRKLVSAEMLARACKLSLEITGTRTAAETKNIPATMSATMPVPRRGGSSSGVPTAAPPPSTKRVRSGRARRLGVALVSAIVL